jgi:hypothetical protein
MIGVTELRAITKLVDCGAIKMGYVPTDHDGNCLYHFQAWTNVTFVFFCDAGDWDYLHAVIVDGEIVADYDKLNPKGDIPMDDEDQRDEWMALGTWMPSLPYYLDCPGVDTDEET